MPNTWGLSLQNDDDAAIVARVLEGETAAYSQLVARYRTHVNERILERTKREKRIRCERGITAESTTAS